MAHCIHMHLVSEMTVSPAKMSLRRPCNLQNIQHLSIRIQGAIEYIQPNQ
jgi:hypothetical protein